MDAGGEGGESRSQSAEPGPDENDDWPGHQAPGIETPIRSDGLRSNGVPWGSAVGSPTPRGNHPAQPVDDTGEALAQGERRCGHHREQNKNTMAGKSQGFRFARAVMVREWLGGLTLLGIGALESYSLPLRHGVSTRFA
jgi:hypothetical protein